MTPEEYITAEVQRVSELVRAAFSDVPRPKITKRIAVALDHEWIVDDERGDELSALDTEQHWSDISDAEIEEYNRILSWLDDTALRFYAPAFMDYALRHFSDDGHKRVWEILELSSDPQKPLTAFNPCQLEAYREFLKLYGISMLHPGM
jgi:hypothetical protein